MIVFGARIPDQTLDFFKKKFSLKSTVSVFNELIFENFHIEDFFINDTDLEDFKKEFFKTEKSLSERDKLEYGDFQTNIELANRVTNLIQIKEKNPQIIIEPTCGKGNFILAALNTFKNIEKIIGIEIYKPYVWDCKFNIIEFYLNNNLDKKPTIKIHHESAFSFDFDAISYNYLDKKILILGNPPWVTNSKLGSLESINLPSKNNFKKHQGLDAITGKGNFDIAEYITLTIIKSFSKNTGSVSLLVKNSVIKNIIYDQKVNNYEIANISRFYINCKKEFNVSVDASLFYFDLNSMPAYTCIEKNLYSLIDDDDKVFGWYTNKFVSNINSYKLTYKIDGICPFIWRQGVKHDCTNIMELDYSEGFYFNKKNDKIDLEQDLIYRLLKSSDLNQEVISESRKFTIITQKKVGQDTSYIKEYPKTYKYLIDNIKYFDARKSSIYKNKPNFSIFGIGDYSFQPYKIAISGLYKKNKFSLIIPDNEKCIMLDDTCYFIGFSQKEDAVFTLLLLNSNQTADFLNSITFTDAKRMFTKDILMRLDLKNILEIIDLTYLKNSLDDFNEKNKENIPFSYLEQYKKSIEPEMMLF